MNHIDMTFETFAAEVTSSTCYDFTLAELQEFYNDGYNIDDTVEWAEWKLDEELFPF
jgi:hypothetical protein